MGKRYGEKHIKSLLDDHKKVVDELYPLADMMSNIANMLSASIEQGGTIFLMGNGGSAADSQHLAAEFVGRFQHERRGLAAIALNANTSNLTAIANDYGFESVFARQIEALAEPKDVIIGISTSGESANILAGLKQAAVIGTHTVGFTGHQKASIDDAVDVCLKIPSTNTARIQEMHILCGHILCELIEDKIANNS